MDKTESPTKQNTTLSSHLYIEDRKHFKENMEFKTGGKRNQQKPGHFFFKMVVFQKVVCLQFMASLGVKLMAPVQNARTEGVVQAGMKLSFINNSSTFSINKLIPSVLHPVIA